jgi:hypothetical protein
MHGIIFSELQKYVETKYSSEVWKGLLKEAGIGNRLYVPFQTYPDQEVMMLVSTASKLTGQPVGQILEDFGEFIAPDLMNLYRSLVDPRWKTLDFLEHTEATIHRVVRLKNAGAEPPELKVSRASPTEVLITYTSARRMCGVAKGIARGLARHYDESVTITESACMLRGHPKCLISVKISA